MMYLEIMNKNEINIIKHSALIQISNKLSALQRKCYNLLIYTAKKQLESKPLGYEFKIPIKVLLDFYNIGEKNYLHLKEKLRELKNIEVQYNILGKDKKQVWGAFNILAGFNYENGYIYYSFPHQVLKALVEPEIYAYIDLVIIKGLKSKYAIALYENLKDYENIKELKLDMEKFRELMGVEKHKYKIFGTFKTRVIDTAVNEINNSPLIDFTVSYELEKESRKYKYIKFKIHKKSVLKQLEQKSQEIKENAKIDILLGLIPERYRTASLKRFLNISLEEFGIEYIEKQIQLVNSRNNVNDYIAYLKKAILEDYAGFEEQKRIKEEKKQKELEKKKKLEKLKRLKQEIREQAIKNIENLSKEEYNSLIEQEKEKLSQFFSSQKIIEEGAEEAVIMAEMKKVIKERNISPEIEEQIFKGK